MLNEGILVFSLPIWNLANGQNEPFYGRLYGFTVSIVSNPIAEWLRLDPLYVIVTTNLIGSVDSVAG